MISKYKTCVNQSSCHLKFAARMSRICVHVCAHAHVCSCTCVCFVVLIEYHFKVSFYILRIIFKSYFVYGYFACMFVCVQSPQKPQEGIGSPSTQELQTVVSHHAGAGKWSLGPLEEQAVLLTINSSL